VVGLGPGPSSRQAWPARAAGGMASQPAARRLRDVLTLLVVALVAASSVLTACTGRQEPSPTPVPIMQMPVGPAGTIIDQPIQSVEDYIAGLMAYDGQRMWDAYSEAAQQQLAENGASADALQRQLDTARERGARFEEFHRLGTYFLPNGGAFVFYVAVRRGATGPDAVEEIYYVFTVDRDGRIAEIQ
jgi:hypothetical protein